MWLSARDRVFDRNCTVLSLGYSAPVPYVAMLSSCTLYYSAYVFIPRLFTHRGHDLPPTKTKQHDEDIPKSAARVLNAMKIREEFNKKRKRELEEGTAEGDEDSKKKRKKKDGSGNEKISGILPGESLQHYNKCVDHS